MMCNLATDTPKFTDWSLRMKPKDYFDKVIWKFGIIYTGGACWKDINFDDKSRYRKLFAGIFWKVA